MNPTKCVLSESLSFPILVLEAAQGQVSLLLADVSWILLFSGFLHCAPKERARIQLYSFLATSQRSNRMSSLRKAYRETSLALDRMNARIERVIALRDWPRIGPRSTLVPLPLDSQSQHLIHPDSLFFALYSDRRAFHKLYTWSYVKCLLLNKGEGRKCHH